MPHASEGTTKACRAMGGAAPAWLGRSVLAWRPPPAITVACPGWEV